MSMKMNFNSIFLIVLIQSVYLSDCNVENKYAREGENTYIECIFYVGKANESFEIIWFGPDFLTREDYEFATIKNQSVYSILSIKNVTREDEGKYECELTQQTINETNHLAKKEFYLNIINSTDNYDVNTADVVDRPIIVNTADEGDGPIEPPIEPKTVKSTFESNKGEHVTAFPMDKSVDEKIDKIVKIFGSIIFIILIIIMISCICCCIRKRRPKTNTTV